MYLSDTVTLDSNDVFVPLLIPRASPVAISGWSSIWIAAGAVMLAWLFWGGRVRRPKPRKAARRKAKGIRKARR